MATAKKPATARAPRARTAKAPAKPVKPEATPFVTFLVMVFTGLSIVFALAAYAYYAQQ